MMRDRSRERGEGQWLPALFLDRFKPAKPRPARAHHSRTGPNHRSKPAAPTVAMRRWTQAPAQQGDVHVPEPMLAAKELILGYRGRPVFDGASFELDASAFALLGPNGAGKSTLMRAIVGLKRPSAGQLHVCGADVADPGSRSYIAQCTSYLPQQPTFDPRFTVAEHVEYSGWLKGMSGANLAKSVAESIDDVGLTRESQSQMGRLSGGMARRATIAGAMVSSPRLLILDEPTVGLDPAQRAGFRHLMEEVMKSTSVLLSTHLVEDVSSLFENLLVVDSGRVAFCGTATEFIGGPGARDSDVNAADLERAYLGAVGHDE